MGERVAAFVESAAPFDLEDCRRWFASRGMAKFKTPEKVERLDHLPVAGVGQAGPGRPAAPRRRHLTASTIPRRWRRPTSFGPCLAAI